MDNERKIALLRRLIRYTNAEIKLARRHRLAVREEVFMDQMKDVITWILELESEGADK